MTKRIYACYSPSHAPLVEKHFLPSIPEGFDVVLRKNPQVCETGEFGSVGFSSATRNKISLILEAIERETEPFVVSDVDIRFYNFTPSDLENEMESLARRKNETTPQDSRSHKPDLICQDDHVSLCTGFMFIRPNSATHNVFKLALDNCLWFSDDQAVLNNFVLPRLAGQVVVSILPNNRYWNIGPNCPNQDDATPPPNLAIHHANWVIGIQNKMRLLDSVMLKVCSGA